MKNIFFLIIIFCSQTFAQNSNSDTSFLKKAFPEFYLGAWVSHIQILGNLEKHIEVTPCGGIQINTWYWDNAEIRVSLGGGLATALNPDKLDKIPQDLKIIFIEGQAGIDWFPIGKKWFSLGAGFSGVAAKAGESELLLSSNESEFGWYGNIQSPALFIGNSFRVRAFLNATQLWSLPERSYWLNVGISGSIQLW